MSTTIYGAVLVMFLLISLGLIFFIMLQQGKAIESGVSFRTGSTYALFSSSGSSNFITRITAILAMLFFLISLLLSNLSSNKNKLDSEWENLENSVKSEKTVKKSTLINPNNDIP